MSTEENKAVVRRYMSAFWDGGDASVADEVIAPSYTVHDPGTPGREGLVGAR